MYWSRLIWIFIQYQSATSYNSTITLFHHFHTDAITLWSSQHILIKPRKIHKILPWVLSVWYSCFFFNIIRAGIIPISTILHLTPPFSVSSYIETDECYTNSKKKQVAFGRLLLHLLFIIFQYLIVLQVAGGSFSFEPRVSGYQKTHNHYLRPEARGRGHKTSPLSLVHFPIFKV